KSWRKCENVDTAVEGREAPCYLKHFPVTRALSIIFTRTLNASGGCDPDNCGLRRERSMREMSAFRAISFGAMLVTSTPALSQAPVLTFGLIGDLGYRPAEEPLLQNVLDDLNKNMLAFVVHVGDLSSPAYACTDDVVARRLTQFSASAHPFIYTPGDNEWT